MRGSAPEAEGLLRAVAPAGYRVLAESVARAERPTVELALARGPRDDRLLAVAREAGQLAGLEGEVGTREGRSVLVGPASPANLERLRALLPWLRPRPLGLRRSMGFGDRLGLATPGHVRALRRQGGGPAPVFAQQSIRENQRTGRTPRQVLDDATWGVFASGWREGFGADADHVKTPEDVEACAAAGYTLFTFDPGDHVDPAADVCSGGRLRRALERLPWPELEATPSDHLRRYGGAVVELEHDRVVLDEEEAARAAVKYGAAVARVVRLYRHLEEVAPRPVEVEVSVDETESPTTAAQHVYVAGELRRLGVRWVSLAPRFVGRLEKGVDYLGDPARFEEDCARHAAIARALGPYKLSLHSGSDKLSIYPAFARAAGELGHLKTAGTSYLEAWRVAARLDPGLFVQGYRLAREAYERERAAYHVSARLDRAPGPEAVGAAGLPSLLDHAEVRQILHVTFGPVLEALGPRLLALLRREAEPYAEALEAHFARHLERWADLPDQEGRRR